MARRPARPIAVALRITGALLAIAAGLVLVGWLAGRLASDTYRWSQWLLWIPTPAAVLAAVAGLLAGLRPSARPRRRRRRLLTWTTVLLLVAVYFLVIEHRFHRWGPADRRGISILHWNMTHEDDGTADRYARRLAAFDADVSIVTNVGLTVGRPAFRQWAQVQLLVVDARSRLGRPLVIWIVDMPSDPALHRMRPARDARRFLGNTDAPTADIVIGDFNTTRGSAALSHGWPGLVHAFDRAGRGYGATFHRRWPLYHIDHLLIRPDLPLNGYELIDPGTGRHTVQIGYLKTSD
jgi:hypothetical protein